METKKILIKVEYLGERYSGWQVQSNASTVQQTLQDVFRIICRRDVIIKASSRTDSGVHAVGQVADLEIPHHIRLNPLFRSVNALLPQDIAVTDMVRVDDDFSARRNNVGKRYLYRILNSQVKRPMDGKTKLWQKKPLNLQEMSDSAECFVGEHDFSAFRGKGCQQSATRKQIFGVDVNWKQEGIFTDIRILIEGSGFLKNMVRVMVGTLIEIGAGKATEEKIRKALKSGKREDAGKTAPPEGLTLDKVFYQPDPFETPGVETWQDDLR